MSNDSYLIASYFSFLALTLAMGFAVCLVLRRPVERFAEAVVGAHSRTIRGILSSTMLLAAMAGFFGISYTNTGCGNLKYEDVVKDRSYLHETNRKQVHNSANWLLGVIVVWSVAGLVIVIVAQKRESE